MDPRRPDQARRSTGRQDERPDERVSWPVAAEVGEGDLGSVPTSISGLLPLAHSRAMLWKMVTFMAGLPWSKGNAKLRRMQN